MRVRAQALPVAEIVLDASAILAVIFDEAGAERVARYLPGALVSTVNLAEVMTKLVDLGMPPETVDAVLTGLQLTVRPFDLDHAAEAARLRNPTREAGLPLGDRAYLATAKLQKVSALTADRGMERLTEVDRGENRDYSVNCLARGLV